MCVGGGSWQNKGRVSPFLIHTEDALNVIYGGQIIIPLRGGACVREHVCLAQGGGGLLSSDH